jgi:hypothetical protein
MERDKISVPSLHHLAKKKMKAPDGSQMLS